MKHFKALLHRTTGSDRHEGANGESTSAAAQEAQQPQPARYVPLQPAAQRSAGPVSHLLSMAARSAEAAPEEKPTPTAPASFFCPVSMELMSDPVIVATGHTYDRVCIQRWIEQSNRTCPVTGMRLRHLELTPNHALRNAIQVSRPPPPAPHATAGCRQPCIAVP